MQHQSLNGKLKAKWTVSLLDNYLPPSDVYSMVLQYNNFNCIMLPKHDKSFSSGHKWTRTETSDLYQPHLLLYSEFEFIFSYCTGPSYWKEHAHILVFESREKFNYILFSSKNFHAFFFIFFQKSQTHRHLQGQVSVYAGQMLDFFFPLKRRHPSARYI